MTEIFSQFSSPKRRWLSSLIDQSIDWWANRFSPHWRGDKKTRMSTKRALVNAPVILVHRFAYSYNARSTVCRKNAGKQATAIAPFIRCGSVTSLAARRRKARVSFFFRFLHYLLSILTCANFSSCFFIESLCYCVAWYNDRTKRL